MVMADLRALLSYFYNEEGMPEGCTLGLFILKWPSTGTNPKVLIIHPCRRKERYWTNFTKNARLIHRNWTLWSVMELGVRYSRFFKLEILLG